MPVIFIACLFLSLWLAQGLIILPITLGVSFHLPFWLSLILGSVVFSWLFGE